MRALVCWLIATFPPTSLFHLEQTWTSDAGKPVPLTALAGTPTVIALVYTTCQGACPMIVSDMLRIDAALSEPQKKKVRFVLFSFDPARDTAARLREYRRERGLDERWSLLRATDVDARELAEVLGVKYARLPNGDFQHSNLVSIVDADGVVRKQVEGLGTADQTAVTELVRLLR